MGKTKIKWTGVTWNPIRGCSLVSKGCEHCYAMRQAHRQSGPGGNYEGLTRMTPTGPKWTGEIRLIPEKLEQPLRWQKPRMIFVDSMSDAFHDEVPDSFLDRLFTVMALTRRHTYQLLTKRPRRMLDYCRSLRWQRLIECANNNVFDGEHGPEHYNLTSINARSMKARFVAGETAAFAPLQRPPLHNLWLGVTAENQEQADKRLPVLFDTPAALRFVSVEPILEPISLGWAAFALPDWVIVGGESGPNRREMKIEWIEDIVEQCKVANVPVFVKQGSHLYPGRQGDIPDHLWKIKEFPADGLKRIAERSDGDE